MPTQGVALLLALLALPAHGQGGAVKRQDLKRVNAEIEETKREIEAHRAQEKALTEEMRGLEANTREAKTRAKELDAGLKRTQGRLGELAKRVETLRLASGSTRGILLEEVRAYALVRHEQNDLADSTDLWRDSLRRQAVLEKAAYLRRLEGLGAKTTKDKDEAGARERELLAQSNQARAARERLELRFQEKQQALTRTKQELQAAAKRQAELEESARALTKLIAQAARSRPSSRPGPGRDTPPIPKHSLPWPASGEISEYFGRQKNPELGTWVIRQGIRLRTAADAPVSAVAAGQVIFAGVFRSYGRVVIVDHGLGFYSVYGDLGKILKAGGDKVAPGDALGLAGKGQGRSGSLYLELRQGSAALDPLAWLTTKQGKTR